MTSRIRITMAVAVIATCFVWPGLDRWQARRQARMDVKGLATRVGHCGSEPPPLMLAGADTGFLLDSWESIGGCGAGASTGSGAGVKWIGRGASGGLFQVQCQANYVRIDDKRQNYVGTVQVTRDLAERWNLGVVVPYLYKQKDNLFDVGVDVANKGLGDVNAMLTRRLGPINATSLTLSVGLPTGSHDSTFRQLLLPENMQLGLGKPTASLVLDHTIDNIWGPIVVGATAGYRGGQNDLGNFRGPSATGYGYAGYLVGPFVPALGLSLTGAPQHDRDQAVPQNNPRLSAAVNGSLEFSTDWIALLVGASVPFSMGGIEPWTVALGVSFAPF